MRLAGIHVDRLPGLAGLLSVSGLQAGMNVIVGPNASGKSSLIRAVTAALYPGRSDEQVAVRLDLQDASGKPFTVRRLGTQVEWQAAGELTRRLDLPPAELLGAYLLRLEDLIALDARHGGEVDDHISGALELELTGGVDLRALRAAIPKQKTAGRKESSALKHAQSELNSLRRRRAALVQRQARLTTDRQELAHAESVAERGTRVSVARELADALQELRTLRSELEAMPAQLARLTGEEVEEVSRRRHGVEACRAERDRLLRELADAEVRLASVTLPEDLTASEARRAMERAEELYRREHVLEQKEVAAQGARAARQAAWRRMGGLADAPAEAPDPQVVDRVERLVQRQIAVRGRVNEIEKRLGALGNEAATGNQAENEGAERLDALGRCRSDVVRWFDVAADGRRVPGWAWGVALLLGAATAGLALVRGSAATASLPVAPWLPAAASLTLLVWLALCLWLSRRTAPAARVAAENLHRSAAAARLAVPAPLTGSAAGRLLEEVVAEIARLERENAAAREREREARDLQEALADATREAQYLRSALAELRARYGFAVAASFATDGDGVDAGEDPDGGFAYWLGAALEHARALTAEAKANGEVRDLEDRVGDARSEVAAFLSRCAGYAPAADAPGADLLSACKDVAAAVEERDRAHQRVGDLRRALDRTEADLRSAESALDGLGHKLFGTSGDAEGPGSPVAETSGWSSSHLSDLALAARDLVDALPAWREARARCQRLEVAADIHARSLSADPELLAAARAGDIQALDDIAEEARQASQRVEQLTDDINAVAAEVRAAQDGRALEEATAKARQALDTLEEHLDAALESSAARTLLDLVEEEHESAVKPAALERARSWFERFTHGDFELTFTPDGAGGWRFGAVDRRAGAGGLRLNLSELSTGTRAQLLIAARLAFALEAESSYGTNSHRVEPLPFFLDEALTTSDHERFFQVANAIFDVVDETGRQFIYLSARNEDAELWRDVAAERGASVASVHVKGSAERSQLA